MNLLDNLLAAQKQAHELQLAERRKIVEDELQNIVGKDLFSEIQALTKIKYEVNLPDIALFTYELSHPAIGDFRIEGECDEHKIPHLCVIQGEDYKRQNVWYFYNFQKFEEFIYLLAQLHAEPAMRKIGIRTGARRT